MSHQLRTIHGTYLAANLHCSLLSTGSGPRSIHNIDLSPSPFWPNPFLLSDPFLTMKNLYSTDKPPSLSFPKSDLSLVFTGFDAPCRFEGDIFHLEVEGEIPKSINGTFYRVMPDHAFPPTSVADSWINGALSVAIRVPTMQADFT